MRKELKEIQEKYGEDIFRLAITHLIHVGIDKFSKLDIDALCEEALRNIPDNAIMSGTYQVKILRCAYEICKYSADDLMKFVKTDVSMPGIPPHISLMIAFRSNATERLIMSCMLPPDANREVLNDLTVEIERREDEYEREHGSLYGFDLRCAIENAANALKIPLEPIPYDEFIYL